MQRVMSNLVISIVWLYIGLEMNYLLSSGVFSTLLISQLAWLFDELIWWCGDGGTVDFSKNKNGDFDY